MPDSLSVNDLNRLRAIYPQPPYNASIPAYSMFMGDYDTHRGLRYGSTQPIMRLRRHENVSSQQPYTVYDDPDVSGGVPADDNFPFQTYYYLMDYDHKGPIAAKRGSVVMVPASRLRRRGLQGARQVRVPQAQPPIPRPYPGETFITLEGFGT